MHRSINDTTRFFPVRISWKTKDHKWWSNASQYPTNRIHRILSLSTREEKGFWWNNSFLKHMHTQGNTPWIITIKIHERGESPLRRQIRLRQNFDQLNWTNKWQRKWILGLIEMFQLEHTHRRTSCKESTSTNPSQKHTVMGSDSTSSHVNTLDSL